MNILNVGVGDCRLSREPDTVLATYALGSCIAVAIHDPAVSVAGLLHYLLPESSSNPEKAKENPWLYADTGIPLLFRSAYGLGADKKRLCVRVIGGAEVLNDKGIFNIGKRNHLALRKIFWKAGVMVHAEEVGGTESRNVRLEVGTGSVWIKRAGAPERLMPPSLNLKGAL